MREGGRKGGRKGRRDGGREGGREGRREGEGMKEIEEGGYEAVMTMEGSKLTHERRWLEGLGLFLLAMR